MNAVWVTDVTCVRVGDGRLFRAVMLDLFARHVVGCARGTRTTRCSPSRRSGTPCALGIRDRGSCINPTAGAPYASGDYRRALASRGLVASMGRRGDGWDNAVAESFFATIKTELTEHTVYATRDAAITSIAEYIERFYNPERRHSHLGHISRIEFELNAQVLASAA